MLALKAAKRNVHFTSPHLHARRPNVLSVRWLAVVANAPITHKSKVWDSVDEAVKGVKSGDILLSGGTPRPPPPPPFYSPFAVGFGLSGIPETLLAALSRRTDLKQLVAVSNNAGAGDHGLGAFPPTPKRVYHPNFAIL